MMCRRWTLALIIFLVLLLVTVISAFRVRLSGTSHEVKSDTRKHKCEDCDVSDLNLDPITRIFKKESAKYPHEDIKKSLRDKRNLIEEKLTKVTFEKHKESKEDIDDEHEDTSDVVKTAFESVKLKSDYDVKVKTKSKKASIIIDLDDNDDSDIEDDDEYDDEKQKDPKKILVTSSSKEIKKKVDTPLHLYKEIKPLTKPKIPIKDEIKTKIDSSDEDNEIKEPISQPLKKSKIDITPTRIVPKEDRKLKDEAQKPEKYEIKDKIKDEIKKKRDKNVDKVKIKSVDVAKEPRVVKPLTEKVILTVKNDIIDKEKIKPNKIDDKVTIKKIKAKDTVTEPKIETSIPIISPKKEKIKIVADDETLKQPVKVTDEKESVIKSDSKETRVQHLSDALQRRNLFQSSFEDFYSFFPTFAPNFSRIHNPECRRHGQILLRQLRGSKLWALNMLDATAKIPSGLLQGNGIQLGDFDQCLGVRARVQLDTGSVVKLQGKYCLAMFDVKAEHPDLEAPVYLAQARNIFKSRIDDPGHFVPRFSTLSWGVCVPSPCGAEDVEVVLRDAIKHYQYKTGISIRVRVDERDCHVKKGPNWWKDWLDVPTILTLSLYAIVVIIVLLATLQDYFVRNRHSDDTPTTEEGDEDKNENKTEEESASKETGDGFFSSFSLYNSLGKLIAPVNKDEIACIHGLRGITTIVLLGAHKFLPVALTPYTNRLRLSEIVSSAYLSICRAGWMYTDCFLLLSGTLTSYRKSSNDTIASKLLARYIRLTPALLVVVIFYAYVWDNLSSGPMWGTLVTKNAEVCQQGWWWNLLYVQNYYGFEEMCAPQTHHMALDFQLTIIGGIIVWAIQSEVPFAGTVMPLIHTLSAYSRYTTFREHRLTVLAYQGVSVSQLYRTSRLSYSSTFHRCSPYLIGLSLGLALRKPSTNSKLTNILGWLVSVTLMGLALWAGVDSGSLDYRYDVMFSALYGTVAPIATAFAFAWLIYGVHNDHSKILSSLLSSRPLLFISRISYAMYLVQFIVYLNNTATTRSSKELSLFTVIDLQEILTILVSSIFLTIMLVIPLQSLKVCTPSKTNQEEENSMGSENAEPVENNKAHTKVEREDNVKDTPQIRRSLIAHREVLEEIPEAEVEYEIQRDTNEGLEEILEEEDEGEDDELREEEEDLEIIEEEQEESGEDFWAERRRYLSGSYLNDQDLEEWEWTANGSNRARSQQHRYNR